MRRSSSRSSGQVDHSSGGTTAGFEGATVGGRSSVDIPSQCMRSRAEEPGCARDRREPAFVFTAHPACGIPQRRSARVGASRPVQEPCLLHESPEQRKQCNNADTADNGAHEANRSSRSCDGNGRLRYRGPRRWLFQPSTGQTVARRLPRSHPRRIRPTQKPEEPAKYEETVVVSASRTEEKLINAPATMSVITERRDRERAVTELRGAAAHAFPG